MSPQSPPSSARRLQSLFSFPSSFYLAIILYFVAVLVIQFLPPTLVKFLNSESGPFEQGSIWLWLAAVLMSLASAISARSKSWLSAAIIFIYTTLREMDFQVLFTHRSVMSLGYFTGTRAPLPEKALVLVILLPCVASIAYLVRRAWLAFRSAQPQKFAPVVSISLLISLVFIWSHLHDRGAYAWIRFHGHIEALNEAFLAMLVLLTVAEFKPSLLKQPDS